MSAKRLDFDPDGDLLLHLTYSPDDSNDDDEEQLVGSLAEIALKPASYGRKQDKVSAPNEVRMLVSSKHLMLASPVFKAMFNPEHFREGKLLGNSDEVPEVEFPDDEPETLELLMNIIHGRARRVPSEISFGTFTNLTILVDKYQMVEPAIPYIHLWLARHKTCHTRTKNFTPQTLLPWLCIAWTFNVSEIFKPTTAFLVKESESRLEAEGIPIPDCVLDAIESQRVHGISTLIEAIAQYRLWPLPQAPYLGFSIWSIANTFRALKTVAHKHYEPSHPLHGVDLHPHRYMKTFLNDTADAVWRNATGLDIKSIRGGPQKSRKRNTASRR
ncbi:uncharacterized protein PAC_10447 [Phialocephala subalpina]|uniref:BTB domain-containing protein n=1 Tax=Phialocephala subalpina TaxID=576137 RepID=A0A1L7X6A9_9HELO|nr:uncharacterized protein PAC_10447 [Phialocephala subalpina]